VWPPRIPTASIGSTSSVSRFALAKADIGTLRSLPCPQDFNFTIYRHTKFSTRNDVSQVLSRYYSRIQSFFTAAFHYPLNYITIVTSKLYMVSLRTWRLRQPICKPIHNLVWPFTGLDSIEISFFVSV
jgi:hypothetical protein